MSTTSLPQLICGQVSLYDSNGSLSELGLDSEITLPRNSVYEPTASNTLGKGLFFRSQIQEDHINDKDTKSGLIKETLVVEDEGSAASTSEVGDEGQAKQKNGKLETC